MPLAKETTKLMSVKNVLLTSSAVLAGLAGYYAYKRLIANDANVSKRRVKKEIFLRRYRRSKQNHEEVINQNL